MTKLALALALVCGASTVTAEEIENGRTFLVIGEPNAAAWKFMIDTPSDREASMSHAVSKLGGEMVSYYWGLGNGRNYTTIRMPNDPGLIQALYVSRLGDGLLSSYQMIELIESPAMAAALARVPEVKAVDTID